MTNEAIANMQRLQAGLAAESLDFEAELTTFPSGSAMLDVRRAGRAFVMAYSPQHGFAVDELQPDDGLTAGYRFVFQDFEPAARQFRALATNGAPQRTSAPTLSLVVIQSADVKAAKEFYRMLGLSFVEEQHGSGPRHLAATLGPLVLEIYPCRGDKPAAPLRMGFQVRSLDETLELLRGSGSRIIREAHDSPWGRRAIVEDPDGNRIELA
jgi:predicted enzyme related to lactoylglutathione lyase